MKVLPVELNSYTINKQKKNRFKTQNMEVKQDLRLPEERSAYYGVTNFRGNTMAKLWDEYNWYIRHDRAPAIQSFLKIKETPEVMDKFLTSILETEDRSKELIHSIVYKPRQTMNIHEKLKEILPANSVHLNPFFYDSPYNKSYSRFIDSKVHDSHSVEDLLRMRPDWRGDVLLSKYQQLRNSSSLEIGNIPHELPRKHLKQIVEYLAGQMEYGFKRKKKIEGLKLDNRIYEFAFFTEGKSDKNVFGVFTPEGKKYVLKMSDPKSRSLDKPFALGTLAKIDSYLTYNRSRNAAPLCYYNHDKNFSIYKYIEHVPVDTETHDLRIIAENMPDFKALGLAYNDTVGYKNFFRLAQNSSDGLDKTEGFFDGINRREWISVDNDHVTYSNVFQPSISKYHTPLPNAMQICL